jgi:hypothetical protein
MRSDAVIGAGGKRLSRRAFIRAKKPGGACRKPLQPNFRTTPRCRTRCRSRQRRFKSSPKIGRAEPLREAMFVYLNDASSSPNNAYPAFWSPFALIEVGAAR